MSTGKIGIVAGGLAVLMLLTLLFLSPHSAIVQAVENETTTYAQVAVAEFISTSLVNVPIDFGTLNPGVINQQANAGNGYPMNVSIEPITNVITNISLRGTAVFNRTAAPYYTFGIGNMSFSNTTNIVETGSEVNMSTTSQGDSIFSNFDNIPVPGGTAQIRSVYFWIDVPSGQPAGTYQANVYVKVQSE